MATRLYLDIETVGLCGPVKLIQYSVDRGPVQFITLLKGWDRDVYRGLANSPQDKLCRLFAVLDNPDVTVVGYNIKFDLYHLYRLRHRSWGYAETDQYRPVPPFKCRVLDLYTHAVRVGPFAAWAYTSNKMVAKVRRIPRIAMNRVRAEVEAELKQRIPATAFLNCHEQEVKGKPELVTLGWSVYCPMTLKAHAEHYGEPVQKLDDVWPLPAKGSEKEHLPYPEPHIHDPIEAECDRILEGRDPRNVKFFKYAEDDIKFLWVVEDGLGNPEPDHHDDNTHIVAYTRYYGFPLDLEALRKAAAHYTERQAWILTQLDGVNPKSSPQCLAKLQTFEPWIQSSNKAVLAELARSESPAKDFATALLEYRRNKQYVDQITKLLECKTGRAHPDMRVMGTKTYRMAGTGGLNFQGVGGGNPIRKAVRCDYGGDFSNLEICIAASVWNEPKMLDALDNGVDLHKATAAMLFDVPYDDVTKDQRNKAKRINFGILYGCAAPKAAEVLGDTVEAGQRALDKWLGHYARIGEFRREKESVYCTADIETWNPKSVETMDRVATDLFGFSRRFDFEADVAGVLWRLGQRGIVTGCTGTVTRSPLKGPQPIDNAIRSALLGSAIAIQQAVYRAAVNMPIQATGANICKMLAALLWRKFHVPMMNVHDELMFPHHPHLEVNAVQKEVRNFEQEMRAKVTHLAFDDKPITCWADKG